MSQITGTEGNDQGIASLIGTADSDTIVGLGGDDSIDAQAGNDTISVRVAGGYGDTVHGGIGTDSLAVQLDVAGAINFDSFGPGGHIQFVAASSSLAQLLLMATGTSFKLGLGNYAYAGVAFDGIENLSIQAFNAVQNDLLVVFGQGTYDGGPGTDTLFADWSTQGATFWANLADGAQGVNGSSISNVERLLIRTGSGDDDLRNTVAVTSDEFETGQGNDTVHAGGGADRIDLGDGDDFARVISAAGWSDTVVGGNGTDTLYIDASTSGETGISWSGNDAGGQSVGGTVISASSLTSVAYLLANAFWLDMNTGNGLPGVIFNTLENLSIEASTAANFDDLLLVRGMGHYNGAGGTDTLFADWSLASMPIAWDNQANTTSQNVNGSTVSNVERLLLRTGSGNDHIRNTVASTNDEFETGAGEDTIDAGSGLDRIDAGAGDDEIHLVVNTALNIKDTVNGGAGSDALFADASAAAGRLDWEAYGSDGSYLGMALYNSSLASIGSVLAGASRYAIGGLTFEGIENLSLLASTTSPLDDLMVVLGSGTYSGGGGVDTLYADWSAAQGAIVWNNLADASTHSVNGSTISGVERLLLKTGSGNDDIRNLVAGTHDEFETGAGNDTVHAGAGNDRIFPGTGNDTVDGGAGADTAVFAGNKSLYTVTRNASATLFIVSSDAEGTDRIANVENLQFADGTFSASSFTNVDNTAPAVVSYNPTDEATGVPTPGNIAISFGEPIERASGTVWLKNNAGAVIESFDVATSARITVAGSTLTIDPSADLASMTGYRVELDAGSLTDRVGNAMAAITSYNFTTGAASYIGTPGDDALSGDSWGNLFMPGLGNDSIDARDGQDTVALPMFPNAFSLSEISPGHVSGSYGTKTAYTLDLQGVELVRFGGEFQTTLALEEITSGRAQEQLARLTDLYLAFFGRAPDVGGLEYWQENLLELGRDFATISRDFAWSNEAQALFPLAASNREFVRTVYLNCFGRQPDAGGWDYWTEKLDGLGVTDLNDRGAFVGELILGAYASTSGEEDRSLLTHRHEVAMYYANRLAIDPGEGFDAAINALLTRVSGDAATEGKAEDVIDHAFANPITLTGVMADQALLDSIWGA